MDTTVILVGIITLLFIVCIILIKLLKDKTTTNIENSNIYTDISKKIESLKTEYQQLQNKYLSDKNNYRLLLSQLDNLNNTLKEKTNNFNSEIASARLRADEQLSDIKKSVDVAKTSANAQIEEIHDHLSTITDAIGERCIDQSRRDYEDSMNTIIQIARDESASCIENLTKEIEAHVQERDSIKKEIDAFQLARQAINEEISRERALAEQQDFYRIVLSNEDKQDIDYILSIVPNFRHSETLYKLIWSEYIQKAFKATLKNVLGSRDPKNIIYIIQNINTKEIYIGKTAQCASDRWTSHVKTSLYISGTKPSAVHKAMYRHWDEFTFNVLEEVPADDDLSARERYWINFYQSNVYGYNVI